MKNSKKVDQEIVLLTSLKSLVDVYGQIASIRMRKIRHFVLTNRDFLNVITDIFYDVLHSYARRISKMAQKGKSDKGRVTFLAHNGKTVAVFLSANTGFYGDVVQNTFRKFVEDVRKSNFEVTIVGKLGASLFAASESQKPYTYFELPDYGIDKEKLSELVRHLVEYEEIRVYYGKYETVVRQTPTMFKIASGAEIIKQGAVKDSVEYIFEPSVEDVLGFFETQIFASLFDQAVRESQLAKFSSRIIAMDTAGENIKVALKNMNLEKLRIKHRVENRRQLDSLGPVIYRQSGI